MAQAAHPARIGRYEIHGVLGRGAMGVVYRGHDPAIERGVAIKLLSGALPQAGDAMERLRAEARAAGRCQHQNIVGLYDLSLQEGVPFLVMEMVEGCDLAAALRRAGGRLPAGDAVALVLQILAALQAAHREGVIHRDIKPGNILLDRRGQAKVSDFGVSFLRQGGGGAARIAGTPSYMSPEQCRGEGTDERSDLFSTGVLLHELLLGRRPFAGDTPAAVMRAIQQDDPEIAAGNTNIADDLRAVLLRALARPPAARFASAAEMAAALRACAVRAAPDATLLAAEPAPAEAGLALPEATVQRMGQLLGRHIGPIAGHLVRRALRQSNDAEALAASLATQIEQAPARDRFNLEALALLREAAPTPAPPPLPPQEVDVLLRSLSTRLGPIARLVVEAERPKAASMAMLWTMAAQHLDTPEERQDFLRDRPGLFDVRREEGQGNEFP